MDREISAPGHGKDVLDGLNAIVKFYLKEKMNRLSNNIIRNCEGLGMLNSDSSK